MSMYSVKELKEALAKVEDNDQLVFLLDYDRDGYSFDCYTKDGEYVFGESLVDPDD